MTITKQLYDALKAVAAYEAEYPFNPDLPDDGVFWISPCDL